MTACECVIKEWDGREGGGEIVSVRKQLRA